MAMGSMMAHTVCTCAHASTAISVPPVRLRQAASEARRSALLPTSPALDWDSLMQTPAYLQALALLP